VTTSTYASTNNRWARPASPLLSSSKIKPCQFSSVTSCLTLQLGSWRRSIVVRTSVLAGELFLSCARLMDGRLTTLWVKRPLSVNEQGQLSLPSLRARSVKWVVTHYMGYGRWGPWYSWLWLPAGRCASLCLQAARGGREAGSSGKWLKRIEACSRRCAIQIDDLYFLRAKAATTFSAS